MKKEKIRFKIKKNKNEDFENKIMELSGELSSYSNDVKIIDDLGYLNFEIIPLEEIDIKRLNTFIKAKIAIITS